MSKIYAVSYGGELVRSARIFHTYEDAQEVGWSRAEAMDLPRENYGVLEADATMWRPVPPPPPPEPKERGALVEFEDGLEGLTKQAVLTADGWLELDRPLAGPWRWTAMKNHKILREGVGR